MNFQEILTIEPLIFSERANEDEALLWSDCFNRYEQIEKNLSNGANSVQSNELVSRKTSHYCSHFRSVTDKAQSSRSQKKQKREMWNTASNPRSSKPQKYGGLRRICEAPVK